MFGSNMTRSKYSILLNNTGIAIYRTDAIGITPINMTNITMYRRSAFALIGLGWENKTSYFMKRQSTPSSQ